MDLLVFDAKKRYKEGEGVPVALEKNEIVEMVGDQQIEAFLNGGLVQIIDRQIAEILHEMAGIGEWLEDERQENVMDIQPAQGILVLSPLETIFLTDEWKILEVRRHGITLSSEEIRSKMREISGKIENFENLCKVYRFLRRNGWVVRSGATFGCDFLIYSLGAQHFHASAGVVVADEITPWQLLTLTRILAHNKKALMLATCQKTSEVEEEDVKLVTMKTYFLERDVAQMSNKTNELYDFEENKID